LFTLWEFCLVRLLGDQGHFDYTDPFYIYNTSWLTQYFLASSGVFPNLGIKPWESNYHMITLGENFLLCVGIGGDPVIDNSVWAWSDTLEYTTKLQWTIFAVHCDCDVDRTVFEPYSKA
jgi:hypothetical protein